MCGGGGGWVCSVCVCVCVCMRVCVCASVAHACSHAYMPSCRGQHLPNTTFLLIFSSLCRICDTIDHDRQQPLPDTSLVALVFRNGRLDRGSHQRNDSKEGMFCVCVCVCLHALMIDSN